MFGTLTEKFQKLFSAFSGNTKLSEENISSAMKEVRLALLEADVNFRVATSFVQRVKEVAIGKKILESIKPRELFIKIVHDELIRLIGGEEKSLKLDKKPSVILLCGLQGSGKTTHAAKLANLLQKQEKKVLLAACDLQRPAAIDQLQKLALEINVPVVTSDQEFSTPLKIAKNAYEKAKAENFDVLIIDTAGRLHIDEELMQELEEIRKKLEFSEVLYVANAQMGQDAVKTAKTFDERIQITGSILTMMDGDARAGVALSIKEVTSKPIYFEGFGEKVSDLRPLHPKSLADRILGMGDVINLVRAAEQVVDEKNAEHWKKKLREASFTYADYLDQMDMLKKMGSLKSLLRMVPGISSAVANIDLPENELKKAKAILQSMTPSERKQEVELTHHRKLRIQQGSGTTLEHVNKLIKGFKNTQKMLKDMPKKGMFSNLDINQFFGG